MTCERERKQRFRPGEYGPRSKRGAALRGMELGERHEGCLHRLIVRVPVVDALCPHVLREHARVGNKAGDGDADMIVNLEDLLLVGRELAARALQRRHDRVFIRSKPDRCAALLHCLESVLNLVDAPGWRPGGAIGVVLIAEHGACGRVAGWGKVLHAGGLSGGTRGGGGGGVPRPTRSRPHACRRGAVRSIPPLRLTVAVSLCGAHLTLPTVHVYGTCRPSLQTQPLQPRL